MKNYFLILLSLFSISLSAQAGNIITVNSSNLTSFDYKYGDDGDTVTLGVSGKEYKFEYSVLRSLVEDQTDALLKSPSKEQCVKAETCNGNYCSRIYGIHTVNTSFVLIVNGTKIESYKFKSDVGPCL